jgi:DinB family
MRYGFLIDTYDTERLKVLGVWAMFRSEPYEECGAACGGATMGGSGGTRARSRCASREVPPRLDEDSAKRVAALRSKAEAWWEEVTAFFEVQRPRAWIVVRRVAHTSHHRGQQTALLRMLGRDVYSTYGPTADTGGLGIHKAPTIYAYPDEPALLRGEASGGARAPLPGPGPRPPTERPQA